MVSTLRAYASLARWLGPWTAESSKPSGVARRGLTIEPDADGDRSLEAWLYEPAGEPVGAYLIAPGLHYAGPADPRMDRFCSILGASGITVFAPFIPDYTDLRVVPGALRDFRRAFDRMQREVVLPAGARPGIFSISFGSLLALRLAADPDYADRVGALLLFGGYVDWEQTIRFCLTGEIEGRVHGARDPLNQPVVFMNLIDELEGAPPDPTALLAAWRAYVEATWGRQEMKEGERHKEVARTFAEGVAGDARELFLVGCGASPGGYELCADALSRSAERSAFLDPRPHLGGIRCPVHLVHGVDDDVIPYVQSHRLAEALRGRVPVHVHLTGLYGHTSQAGGAGGGLRAAPMLAKELVTMARILRAFVTAGRR